MPQRDKAPANEGTAADERMIRHQNQCRPGKFVNPDGAVIFGMMCCVGKLEGYTGSLQPPVIEGENEQPQSGADEDIQKDVLFGGHCG